MRIDHYIHFHDEKTLHKLIKQGEQIMATVTELVEVVTALAEKVNAVGPAVDAFEARITAILKTVGISAEDQAKIDAAFEALQGVVAKVDAAVADANDGIDEAA